MAEVQILVEDPGPMQPRGDLGHLPDQFAFQATERVSIQPRRQERDRLVQGEAAGQLGHHQEALQLPHGPIRSPAATTSGTSIPSARARSRFAHSAFAGE